MAYFEILDAKDKPKIMENDDYMRIIAESGNDVTNIYPNTKYYYYYDNNVLVAQAYIQSPNSNLHSMLISDPVNRGNMNGMYYIWAVETKPEFRNKGYAQSILNQVIDRHNKYFLCVRNDNHAAIHVYQKIGFRYSHDCTNKYLIMKL